MAAFPEVNLVEFMKSLIIFLSFILSFFLFLNFFLSFFVSFFFWVLLAYELKSILLQISNGNKQRVVTR